VSTQLDAGDSDEHELGASVTENWIWDHAWLDAIIGVVAGQHEKVSRSPCLPLPDSSAVCP
jgi:hypothetical protein